MNSIVSYFKGISHPEGFHGTFKKTDFFEGWYVKIVSNDQANKLAIIPGIFKGLKGDPSRNEAFIQVLDGATGRSWYHTFPTAEFLASESKFDVTIAGNQFDSSGITLDLPNLKGRVDFLSRFDPWPVTFASPGIMGWYGLVPFMECFHGVVSFGHSISGSLLFENETLSFSGGRSYIEKDWGQAFPEGYIWIHSNHLDQDSEASFVGSVAIIPWVGRSFRGFIVGLKHSGKLHKWTTYNRSKELELRVTDSEVIWRLEGPDGILELTAQRKRGGLLHAPLREAMHQRVEETLDGHFHLKHLDSQGLTLLETSAGTAGIEVFGNLQKLLAYN